MKWGWKKSSIIVSCISSERAMGLTEKYRQLQAMIKATDSAAVAYSGGVDSSLLLKVAADCLGPEQVLALTAVSPLFPAYEIEQSRKLAALLGVRHECIDSGDLEREEFINNDPLRCYHCKLNLFTLFTKTLENSGYQVLFEGSNLDDLQDYRPGRKALEELQIRSPLLEAGFTKQDIRNLSRELDLPTWNSQPVACLATRFPYGTRITMERLEQIERCESWLREQGLSHYRVRWHERLARIEVATGDLPRLVAEPLRSTLLEFFKRNGFDYVTLDLQGYRSGSMNETLPEALRRNDRD